MFDDSRVSTYLLITHLAGKLSDINSRVWTQWPPRPLTNEEMHNEFDEILLEASPGSSIDVAYGDIVWRVFKWMKFDSFVEDPQINFPCVSLHSFPMRFAHDIVSVHRSVSLTLYRSELTQDIPIELLWLIGTFAIPLDQDWFHHYSLRLETSTIIEVLEYYACHCHSSVVGDDVGW